MTVMTFFWALVIMTNFRLRLIFFIVANCYKPEQSKVKKIANMMRFPLFFFSHFLHGSFPVDLISYGLGATISHENMGKTAGRLMGNKKKGRLLSHH